MGKYNNFAKRIDTLMKERIAEYEKARDEFKEAEREKRTTPKKQGYFVTPEYQIKAQKAEVRYMEAEKNLKEAKERYTSTLDEVRNLRAELVSQVADDIAINPADLDSNVIAVIQAGLCKPDDLVRMYNSANATTKRYIGSYADKEHRENGKKLSQEDSYKLSHIASDARTLGIPENTAVVRNFDVVCDTAKRTINNPSMAKSWDKLTEAPLSEL